MAHFDANMASASRGELDASIVAAIDEGAKLCGVRPKIQPRILGIWQREVLLKIQRFLNFANRHYL